MLHQLHEERMPSDRGCEDGVDDDRESNTHVSDGEDSGLVQVGDQCLQAPHQLVEDHDSSEEDAGDIEDEDDDSQDEVGSAAEPEWMSFATPDGDMLEAFEELWSQGQGSQDELEPGSASRAATELPLALVRGDSRMELTSEAIWKLVADRAQQEIARALEEAERARPSYSTQHTPRRGVPLRRGQAPFYQGPQRRPKRGERGELVAELARQGAAVASSKASSKAQQLRPVAQRFGNSVARAGSVMQDAGRLAREAGASITGHGHAAYAPPATLMPTPEACAAKPLVTEADARNAKTKVVHAANAVKSKLLHKMPKGLRRPKKDDESSPM